MKINKLLIVFFSISFLCIYKSHSQITLDIANMMTSYAFTDGNFAEGSQSFNIWDDADGSFLNSDNNDADDITITYSSTGTGTVNGVTGYTSLEYDDAGDRFQMFQGFTGTVAEDNPGVRICHTFTMTFADHISITDLQIDYTSLNSRGIAWETSTLAFLDTDGNPFSPIPTINPYLSHTPIDGSSGTGVFVTDATRTVVDVGTDTVTAGTGGKNDNLTQADNGVVNLLDYADVNLAAGTQIGGYSWTTCLEDVRGTKNANTQFTANLFSFTAEGTVPEPSSVLLIMMSLSFLAMIRKRG